MGIHESIKKCFGYNQKTPDIKILGDWKKRTFNICKPCWELNYCPYGSLVEDFPHLPVTREEAGDHNNYFIECIKIGKLGSGDKLDDQRRKWFEEEIKNFNPDKYPESLPKGLSEAPCRVFGHICPVFTVAEPLTETKKRRKHSRPISREVMLRVARRDGQICQKCNKPVVDNEVQFDHIIPFSKGGKSTAENLRLVHADCNRRKSNSVEETLHPSLIEHLFKLRNKKK